MNYENELEFIGLPIYPNYQAIGMVYQKVLKTIIAWKAMDAEQNTATTLSAIAAFCLPKSDTLAELYFCGCFLNHGDKE